MHLHIWGLQGDPPCEAEAPPSLHRGLPRVDTAPVVLIQGLVFQNGWNLQEPRLSIRRCIRYLEGITGSNSTS